MTQLHSNPINAPHDDVDTIVAVMVSGSAAAAAAPFVVGWPLFIGALCTGVIAIGEEYGTNLDSKDEAWKVIRNLFAAAGFIWLALSVSSKLIAALLQTTGIGYAGAVALDVVTSSAIAYAVGRGAQAYFKGERDKDRLGTIFRQSFMHQKQQSAGA
jgi:uncharacterized protein (DUF697 family)